MERTLAGVDLHVIHQVVLLRKSGPTTRNIALEWPLTGVGSHVNHQVLMLLKSAPTVRDVAFVRTFTRMSPLMLSGMF
jgi:hypothetical protein